MGQVQMARKLFDHKNKPTTLVAVEIASIVVQSSVKGGATDKCEEEGNVRTAKKERLISRRTCIHGRQILERRKQEHRDDTHAKNLHPAARHVQHESLHWQRLDG